MRLRGSTKFVLTVLVLTVVNVVTLYFLSTGIHQSPPACPGKPAQLEYNS